MSPEQAKIIAEYLIDAVEQESSTTKRVLAAVPDEGSDYRPDPKSMSGAELAAHVARSDTWFLQSVINAEFGDFDTSPIPKPSESLAYYNSRVPDLIAQLKTLTPEHFAKEVKFHTWNLPAVRFLSIYQHHSIHHRGQLSAYLRPMGSKVPSIYGSSADDAPNRQQEASA